MERLMSTALYTAAAGSSRGADSDTVEVVPTVLAIKDYKTEKAEACSIGKVLRHPYVGRLPTKILVLGLSGLSYLVASEQESSEAERERGGLGL